MKILENNNIEIIECFPAIYIESIDSIVIADLHLGYEGIMAEQGIFIPKIQFKKELDMLSKIIKKKKASRIIINGDIKHEFSETSYHEFIEVSDLLNFLKNNFKEIILIKGNHDNYIARVSNRYNVKLYEEFKINEFYFLHGHKIPIDFMRNDVKTIIIAHEHPAIALYDEIGVKEKIDCLLYGDMKDGRKIIVLPAFSYFAQGSDVNILPKEELLSPILREYVDIDELNVIGISEEVGCLIFPKIGEIKNIYKI